MSLTERIENARLEGADSSCYVVTIDEWNEALEEVRQMAIDAVLNYRGIDRRRELSKASNAINRLMPLIGVLRPESSLRLSVKINQVFDEDNEDDRDYDLRRFIEGTGHPIEYGSIVIALRPPYRTSTGTHGSSERVHLWQSCESLSMQHQLYWQVHLIGDFFKAVPQLITGLSPRRLERLELIDDGSLWKKYLWERWSYARAAFMKEDRSDSVKREVDEGIALLSGRAI